MTLILKNIKFAIIVAIAVLFLALTMTRGKANAACSVDTSRGTVTSTFTAPSTGSYMFWARMQASSATNDSFYISIDGGDCINVGDTGVSTSAWTWVNWKDGSTSNKTAGVQLTQGSHTIQMIGREDSVKVDKLLFLSDATCTPTGYGDNCETTVDNTPPSVSLTSPANNASISGSNVLIQANASDDTAVTKVEFYINSTLLGTDTASPYSFGLNTTLPAYPNGSYKLSARAFDAAGNNTRSTEITVNINNPIVDNTAPQLSITSPLNGATVTGPVNVTSSASDENGVSKVEVYVDNTLLTTLNNAPYTYSLDTTKYSNGNHTITVKAYDPSSNVATKSVNVNVDNTVTPPTPKKADFNNSGVVDLPDLAILLSKYGQSVSVGTNGDCNDDGQVTLQDLAILLSLYGR